MLELGCGPGDVTALLLGRGAIVEAVDASAEMLQVAAKRAPGARFVRADIREYTPAEPFDAVLLLFVLHELPMRDMLSVLSTARRCLADGGRLVIADHALPEGARGKMWRQVLHRVETPAVDDWLRFEPWILLIEAGLTVDQDIRLAGGRVRLTAGFAPPIG